MMLEKSACLNAKFRLSSCEICKNVCPKNCIDDKLDIDLQKCDECGLCAAHCPSGAFRFNAALKQEISSLSCKKRSLKSPFACLGFLNAQILLFLLSNKNEICVDLSSCKECNPAVFNHLNGLIGAFNKLGANIKTSEVKKEQNSGEQRRGFLKLVCQSGVSLISDSKPNGVNLSEFRVKQAGILDEARLESSGLFHSIKIDESCNACELCENICPHGAIKFVKSDNKSEIYHSATLCTACGVCIDHCQSTSISLKSANTISLKHIASVNRPICNHCGRVFAPIGERKICLECYTIHTPSVFTA